MQEQKTSRRIPVKIHRNVSLIRCADASTLIEITSRRSIAENILGQLDERTLIVRPEKVQIVVSELQKADLHPRIIK